MKNFIRATCLFTLIGFSTSFATVGRSSLTVNHEAQIPESGYYVVGLGDLTETGVGEFCNGLLPQIAIEIPEGARLPLNLFLSGDFLTLESDRPEIYTLRVIKTCYLRCVEGIFLFSTDLQNWLGFDEFFSGNVTISLDTAEIVPKIGISIELNQK